MPTIAITKAPKLTDPKWSKTDPKGGEEVELSVTAENLAGQTVQFEIRDPADHVMALLDADGSYKAKWPAPMTPDVSVDGVAYVFYAILRQKPTVANGHQALLMRLKSTNTLKVKGAKITDFTVDSCFVPKQEKFVAKFKMAGELPAKGRYEVWAERYPTGKPVYAKEFTPAAEVTWKWDGQRNDGESDAKYGKYISPEFSPYRLRIIAGPTAEAVEAPYGKGLGKITLAEMPFQIIIQSVQIRVQKDLTEGGDAKYKLRTVLAIEKTPAAEDGTFKAVGRLPKPKVGGTAAEKGRIRIPNATHWGSGQNFDQGNSGAEQDTGVNLYLNKNYVVNTKKFTKDATFYTRPEIPLELEVRLRSRKFDAAPDTDANKLGRFEPEAVGPVRIEPVAEDAYLSELFTGGDAVHQAYWKKATFRIKQGKHDTPVHSATGNKAVFRHWQARFVVANDGDQDFDVSTFDGDFRFVKGQNQLTVYLNRTRLSLASDVQFDNGQNDYKEMGNNKTIKLVPNLTKKDDILWIIGTMALPAVGVAVATWKNYPPGTNAHLHYGGIRGVVPTDKLANLFRQNYSDPPTGAHEPIIGRGTADFPYKDKKYVNLAPDPVPTAQQERVEVQAMTSGAKQGLAGALFSPSYVAGDSYVLHARIEHAPYARNFGEVHGKPWHDAQTGTLTVWRVCHIHSSMRLPPVGTVGLRARTENPVGTVVFDSPADDGLDARDHPGDGINMKLSIMNRHFKTAFNEWTVAAIVPVIDATNATPIEVTAPDHGLANGDCIKIVGVPVNLAANGVFVVGNRSAGKFTLHSAYDFTDADGVGAGVAGTGDFPASVAILDPPTVAISGASNESPIAITTGPDHNLTNGDEVVTKNVGGNLDANGIFKVTKTGAKTFTLDGSDGRDSDAYTASTGTVRRTNCTNQSPIRVIANADHLLTNGDQIFIRNVGGNVAANGIFKVTVVDAKTFTLDNSDGTTSGDYTTGGTIYRCGRIDVHRGANLKKFKTKYDSLGLTLGKVPLDTPDKIEMVLAPFDHYREKLPPNLPAKRRNVASNAIAALAKGSSPQAALNAVKKAIEDYNSNPTDIAATPGASPPAMDTVTYPDLATYPNVARKAYQGGATTDAGMDAAVQSHISNPVEDAALNPGVTAIDVFTTGDANAYNRWVKEEVRKIQSAMLTEFAPQPDSARPKTLPVLRWPYLYHHSVWINAKCNAGNVPAFRTSSSYTVGVCNSAGQARFESQTDEVDGGTFTHEMGHSLLLSHFVVGDNDFNWKQHNLLSGNCLMSYDFTSGYVPRPDGTVGPTGGTADRDTGWPTAVPAPNARPDNLSIAPAHATYNKNNFTIAFVANVNPAGPCAKCSLKLRGWDEEVLPCAWNHPDLY